MTFRAERNMKERSMKSFDRNEHVRSKTNDLLETDAEHLDTSASGLSKSIATIGLGLTAGDCGSGCGYSCGYYYSYATSESSVSYGDTTTTTGAAVVDSGGSITGNQGTTFDDGGVQTGSIGGYDQGSTFDGSNG